MEIGYEKGTHCAATDHIVQELADSNPALFKMYNGEVDIARCLMYLGFDVRTDLPNFNVEVVKDMLIRSSQYPNKAYRTIVYRGWLRGAANTQGVRDKNGNVPTLNPKKLHHLRDLYMKVGILQATDLDEFVSPEDLLDLDDKKWEKS
ncbi:hypothetical protein NVP1161O_164 [Vibrio phage 1.161.O._10N.261.48.C5]|nr:hypothetical protein NVP1161O_164 [Vibrio phage 1.161.O._10N.261.48.C5]